MATVHLPEPGRPQVLIERTGETGILDLDPAELTRLFTMHGAILFRGFGADVDQFRAHARRFCSTSVFNESPGRRPIDEASNILTVDGGTKAFNLHPELAREPWKPDAAFFGCFSAPSRGGETTLCDGVEIVRQMPADLRARFEGRRLLHMRGVWPELLDFWLGTATPDPALLAAPPPTCPYRFGQIDGQLVRYFTRPALHTPLFTDAPAWGNFLLFARFNNGRSDYPVLDDGRPVPDEWLLAVKAIGDRLQVPVAWRPGDVLMLDNSRFLHGRTAIIDPGERHIATFFGYLRFAPRNPEEPPAPPWRAADFRPPLPPAA